MKLNKKETSSNSNFEAEQKSTTTSNEANAMQFQRYPEFYQGYIESTDYAYATSFTAKDSSYLDPIIYTLFTCCGVCLRILTFLSGFDESCFSSVPTISS
ncbi:hypothetical protein P3S68_007037 [Capsicum galapagoense]